MESPMKFIELPENPHLKTVPFIEKFRWQVCDIKHGAWVEFDNVLPNRIIKRLKILDYKFSVCISTKRLFNALKDINICKRFEIDPDYVSKRAARELLTLPGLNILHKIFKFYGIQTNIVTSNISEAVEISASTDSFWILLTENSEWIRHSALDLISKKTGLYNPIQEAD